MTTPAHDHAAMMRDQVPTAPHENDTHRSIWRTPTMWIFVAVGLVGLYYLVTAHTAHFWEYAPYALLLACPFLHFFGHGKHGGH